MGHSEWPIKYCYSTFQESLSYNFQAGNPFNVASNLKEGRFGVGLNLFYSLLILAGSIMGLAVIISSVIQVNDMSQTSLNSLAKRYWIVFYAFSKENIKAYQGTDSEKLNRDVVLLLMSMVTLCYIIFVVFLSPLGQHVAV